MTNFIDIIIAGQQIGLRFGIPAIRRISEMEEKYPLLDYETVQKDGQPVKQPQGYNQLGIAHIFYAAYLNQALVKEETPVHKLEFFYDFVEQAFFAREETPDWELCKEIVKFMGDTLLALSHKKEKKSPPPLTEEAMTMMEKKPPIISITQPIGMMSSPGATAHSG